MEDFEKIEALTDEELLDLLSQWNRKMSFIGDYEPGEVRPAKVKWEDDFVKSIKFYETGLRRCKRVIESKPEGKEKEEWLRIYWHVSGNFSYMLGKLGDSGFTVGSKIDRSSSCRKFENRDIIHPYRLATASYDFSHTEMLILREIIESLQETMKQELNHRFKVKDDGSNSLANRDLFGNVDIIIRLSSLLSSEKDENYSQVRKALRNFQKETIEYEDGKGLWVCTNLLSRVEVNKYKRTVTLRVNRDACDFLVDFTGKQYRKWESSVFSALKSVYSMRWLMLIAGQQSKLTYKIDTLKTMFKLENKYNQPRELIARVVESAKRELDKNSPHSFTYEPVFEKKRKQKGRRKITGISFTPTSHDENRDQKLDSRNKLSRDKFTIGFSERFPDEYEALIEVFSEQDLQKLWNIHSDLFNKVYEAKKNGKVIITQHLIDKLGSVNVREPYFVTSVKNKIEEWEKKLSKNNALEERRRQREKQQINDDIRNNEEYVRNKLNNFGLSKDELENALPDVIARGGSKYLKELDDEYTGKAEDIKNRLLRKGEEALK